MMIGGVDLDTVKRRKRYQVPAASELSQIS
jgi:hypothetical protein